MGAGAVEGALIGSGAGLAGEVAKLVAAGAGYMTIAGIASGAGSGGMGSGEAYMLTNQNTFDITSFSVNSFEGGVIGGISGAFPSTGYGLVGKGATNIVGSGLIYVGNCASTGIPIKHDGIQSAVIWGNSHRCIRYGIKQYLMECGSNKTSFIQHQV